MKILVTGNVTKENIPRCIHKLLICHSCKSTEEIYQENKMKIEILTMTFAGVTLEGRENEKLEDQMKLYDK